MSAVATHARSCPERGSALAFDFAAVAARDVRRRAGAVFRTFFFGALF